MQRVAGGGLDGEAHGAPRFLGISEREEGDGERCLAGSRGQLKEEQRPSYSGHQEKPVQQALRWAPGSPGP